MGGQQSFLLRLTRIAARSILSIFFRLRVEGLSHLPAKGGFVLLPKHQRWEDVPLLGLAAQKPLHYVAKQELFLNPLSRSFMTSLGGIPLNRKRPLQSRPFLKLVLELLREGEGIVVFPEGTYYPEVMGPLRKGLIRMIRNRVPVPFVPVGIRYERKGRPRLVRIAFGRPITGDPEVDEEAFFAAVMGEIARLSAL
ncbi:MAG: lysophospholipid acyltransferase family protein [Thermodesulfobacteriota bacterium]